MVTLAVAQLTEQLLLMPEDLGSKRVIGKILWNIYFLLTVWKRRK